MGYSYKNLTLETLFSYFGTTSSLVILETVRALDICIKSSVYKYLNFESRNMLFLKAIMPVVIDTWISLKIAKNNFQEIYQFYRKHFALRLWCVTYNRLFHKRILAHTKTCIYNQNRKYNHSIIPASCENSTVLLLKQSQTSAKQTYRLRSNRYPDRG